MSQTFRIDQILVARGLFESRAKAQQAIAAGLVVVNGATVSKPAAMVVWDAHIVASAPYPWVSRGGVKLMAGLAAFKIDPSGLFCLDVGASTGGFTQVLLAGGAAHVVAVDVGHGQLHPLLANHRQVTAHEGLDARTLRAGDLHQPPHLIVCDASFISLKLVLPPVLALASDGGLLVALIKPQFEAGRALVRKGVVHDGAVHTRVCNEIAELVDALGWSVKGIVPSPIAGGDGNAEFLIAAQAPTLLQADHTFAGSPCG